MPTEGDLSKSLLLLWHDMKISMISTGDEVTGPANTTVICFLGSQ